MKKTLLFSIMALAVIGMLSQPVFASSTDANDRINNSVNGYSDNLDICDQKNVVRYDITFSGTSRTLDWSQATSTITCHGQTHTLSKVVVVFEIRNGADESYTIDNPRSNTSQSNADNGANYSKVTEITLTYS